MDILAALKQKEAKWEKEVSAAQQQLLRWTIPRQDARWPSDVVPSLALFLTQIRARGEAGQRDYL
jgi:hypothetical protein